MLGGDRGLLWASLDYNFPRAAAACLILWVFLIKNSRVTVGTVPCTGAPTTSPCLGKGPLLLPPQQRNRQVPAPKPGRLPRRQARRGSTRARTSMSNHSRSQSPLATVTTSSTTRLPTMNAMPSRGGPAIVVRAGLALSFQLEVGSLCGVASQRNTCLASSERPLHRRTHPTRSPVLSTTRSCSPCQHPTDWAFDTGLATPRQCGHERAPRFESKSAWRDRPQELSLTQWLNSAATHARRALLLILTRGPPLTPPHSPKRAPNRRKMCLR